MSFILSEDEKRRFVLIIYNFAMLDDIFSREEKLIIESLERDIFKIEPVPKILYPNLSELIGEVERINSREAVYYLFKIGCGLLKFAKGSRGELARRIEEIYTSSKFRGEFNWEEICPWGRSWVEKFREEVLHLFDGFQLPKLPPLPELPGKKSK
jgi:hypothetical protein